MKKAVMWLFLVFALLTFAAVRVLTATMTSENIQYLPVTVANYDATVGVSLLSNTIIDPAARGVITYDTFVNAASYQQDGVMSYAGYQYLAWYHDDLHARIARRALPSGAWEIVELDYQLIADDSHNSISLGISPVDGRIHIAYATHSASVRSTRSAPGVATNPAAHSWTSDLFEPTLTDFPGATITPNFTYPRFERLGDLLLMTWRNGGSGSGEIEMLVYNDDGTWSNRGAFTSKSGVFSANGGVSDSRNAYLNGVTADAFGRLHISWVWREYDRSVACAENAVTNHDLGYAYSDDGGMTWQNSAGAIIGRTGTGDMIGLGDEHLVAEISINAALINQETQRIDSEGRFHTVVSYVPEPYWDDGCVSDFTAGRVAHAMPVHFWRDIDGVWHSKQIPFLQGDVGRAKVVFDSQDNVYVVLPDLRIVAASAAMQWQDWRLVYDAAAISIDGEVIIDSQRAAAVNILSVIYQEANDGVSASALRIADFQLGTLR